MIDKNKIKIIIADSQYLIVESLKSILKGSAIFLVHGIAAAKQDLYRIIPESEHSVLITDPHQLDFSGIDELKKIKEKFPNLSILILAQIITKAEFVELRKAGINNIIFKTTDREELFAAIEASYKNKKYFTPDLFNLIVDNNETYMQDEESKNLTNAEIEIVKLIANGYTTKQIAEQRHVSFHTINTHRKNIFRKLGVSNASELIMQAIKAGWIDNIEYYI